MTDPDDLSPERRAAIGFGRKADWIIAVTIMVIAVVFIWMLQPLPQRATFFPWFITISILIIGTTDGASFTREFVEMRPRLFRVGGSGMDRGRAAFEDFTSSDRPVRWWHVSMPTDSETGQRTVRLPGEMRPMPNLDPRQDALGYAPITRVPVASRIQSSVEDRMMRSFVIIDVDKLGGVSLAQLGDYVAMVALVQVNPDAETGRYETILNLFEQPDSIAGLSGWDRAYMEGIYATRPGRISTMAQVQSITQAILSAYRGQLEEE